MRISRLCSGLRAPGSGLRALGEGGPYVLVGTSGGGFLMAGFAYAHPSDVRGMVFVETPPAIIPKKSPPELRAALKCDSPTNVERRDYVGVENEAWSNRHTIGKIPLIVITNDYGDFVGQRLGRWRPSLSGERYISALSPHHSGRTKRDRLMWCSR